jgi:DNA-directed RNA polymerase specialized sigma subunit
VHTVPDEQNEILAEQQYILEHRMYHLDPAPPKLTAQEYIIRYLTEKEDKYLRWYLHNQESAINKIAQDVCERYAMSEHFADIKQAAVFGILTALQKYDPTIGAPFTAFQKQYIKDSIDDYIRTAQSGVITMTTDTYPVMRRIMAIYHQNGDDCSDDSIREIADETGMDAKTVRKYLAIGTLNEHRADFYRHYADEDGEKTREDISADTTTESDKLYFRALLYGALHRAYDGLTYREQRTVAKHLGFCDNCWSVKKAVLINGEIEYKPIKPMTFEEISHSASRKSDKASERTYNNALGKMRKAVLSFLERWE